MEQLIEIPKADLHPDLAPYLIEHSFGLGLKHPWVFGVPYHEALNHNYNYQYEFKKECIAKSVEKKDAENYIYAHERPYRLEALMECEHWMTDREYWSVVSGVWTDSENIWQNLDEWYDLLTAKRKYKHLFMDKTERKVLKGLPAMVTVYRGCIEGLNEDGFSYTLEKAKAIWFANRFSSKGEAKIIRKTIPKSHIFAYLGGRKESEVIILP